MILYVFNHHFPDNSGFGKRCQKEIEILANKDQVVVVFRKNPLHKKTPKFGGKSITLEPFIIKSTIIERADAYKNGYYEIIRNLDLLKGLSLKMIQVLWKYRKEKKIKLYVVNSPLTVSTIAYILTILFGRDPQVIEFHDVEPELAKDIKKISDDNIVMKITYLLEKFVSKSYKKIVVTSQSQADKIVQRSQVNPKKIHVIPNSITTNQKPQSFVSKKQLFEQYKLKQNDFIIAYSSNLSYDYTITGMALFLKKLPQLLKTNQNIKIVIMGEGEGKTILEKLVRTTKIDNHVIFTGKIANPDELLSLAHIAFIPWEKTELTETILPTKLFDYMLAKKTILAPNFGEFKKVLEHKVDAILYNSTDELLSSIKILTTDRELNKKLQGGIYRKYMRQYRPELYNKEISTIFQL